MLDHYDQLWNSQFAKLDLQALLVFHKKLIIIYAENHNPDAMCLLSSMIYDPDLIGTNNDLKYNLINAFDFMLQAATHPNAPSRFALCEVSTFYRQGTGTE